MLNTVFQNKKQLFALVCETLKYGEVIGDMLDRTKLLDHERALDRDATLARVLVYDLIFGHGVQHAAKKHRVCSCNQCISKVMPISISEWDTKY